MRVDALNTSATLEPRASAPVAGASNSTPQVFEIYKLYFASASALSDRRAPTPGRWRGRWRRERVPADAAGGGGECAWPLMRGGAGGA